MLALSVAALVGSVATVAIVARSIRVTHRTARHALGLF